METFDNNTIGIIHRLLLSFPRHLWEWGDYSFLFLFVEIGLTSWSGFPSPQFFSSACFCGRCYDHCRHCFRSFSIIGFFGRLKRGEEEKASYSCMERKGKAVVRWKKRSPKAIDREWSFNKLRGYRLSLLCIIIQFSPNARGNLSREK